MSINPFLTKEDLEATAGIPPSIRGSSWSVDSTTVTLDQWGDSLESNMRTIAREPPLHLTYQWMLDDYWRSVDWEIPVMHFVRYNRMDVPLTPYSERDLIAARLLKRAHQKLVKQSQVKRRKLTKIRTMRAQYADR